MTTDKAGSFTEIFTTLRQLMLATAASLDVVKDEPGMLQVYTSHIMKNKKPLYFGAVVINKNYVSFHLMPVYVAPDLLQSISPALARRMQGKSCFNFTRAGESLYLELGLLVKKGFKYYKQQGYI